MECLSLLKEIFSICPNSRAKQATIQNKIPKLIYTIQNNSPRADIFNINVQNGPSSPLSRQSGLMISFQEERKEKEKKRKRKYSIAMSALRSYHRKLYRPLTTKVTTLSTKNYWISQTKLFSSWSDHTVGKIVSIWEIPHKTHKFKFTRSWRLT